MNTNKKQYLIKFKKKYNIDLEISYQNEMNNHNLQDSLIIQSQKNITYSGQSNFYYTISSFNKLNLSSKFNSQNLKIKQKSHKYQNSSPLPRYFLFIILFISLFSFTSSAISCTNLDSNQFTDFNIQLFDNTKSIPAGSVVIITFPKQYDAVTLHSNKPYTGFDVFNDYCPSSCNTVTINYSAYVFILNNMFPIVTSQLLFSYTIFNIKNPAFQGTTGQFLIQIRDSTLNNVLYSQNPPGMKIIAQPFQSLTATLDLPYLWTISQPTFNILLTKEVDYIQLNFPSRWQNESRSTNAVTSEVLVNSPTHQINSTKILLKVKIDFPDLTLSSQTLTFTLKSIYNPSSMMDIGPIVINAFNFAGKIIRKTNFYISKSYLTFDQLRYIYSYIVYDTVNNKIVIHNQFKFPRDVVRDDKILIKFPNQITISNSVSDYQVYRTGILLPAKPTFPGNNTIQISPFTASFFQTQLDIVTTLSWPKAVTSTDTFLLQTFRKISSSAFAKMDQVNCCALWIKQKPTLIAALTLSSNQRLKTNVLYKFDLTQKFTTLNSTDGFVIRFPTNYQLDSSKQTATCASIIIVLSSNPSNLNPSYSCTLSNNTLTLLNLFVSNQPPALLSISINIDNPPSPPVDNFQIWSRDSSSARIQSNNLLTVTIKAAQINSVSITPSSFTTNQKANYTFTVSSVGLLSKNNIIKVIIPPQVNLMIYSISCQINSVAELCSYDKTNRTIKMISSNNLVSTNFQFKINNFINPQTLSPTSNFIIDLLDALGKPIQSSQLLVAGLNVQMTLLDIFLYKRMQFSNSSLDSKGNLNFLLVTNNNLDSTSSYKIDLILSSSSYLYLNNSTSILTVNSITKNYTYSNASSLYSLSFTFTPSSNTNIIQFSFNEVYIFSDLVIFNTTLSKLISSTYYTSTTLSSNVSLTAGLNSVLITNYIITQDNYYMNQPPEQITFKINSISPNISFAYIIINIPKNYQSSLGTYYYNSTNNSTTVSFAITGLLNPIQIILDYFTFLLYDLNNQIVGVSKPTNQYFNTNCTYPCRNCKSLAEPTLCADCYQFALNPFIYLRQTQSPYGVCTDQCIKGQYLNVTTKKCSPCSSNCSSCLISNGGSSGDPQNCSSCAVSNFLYNNRCYSTCPNGFYSNGIICSPCTSNCAICSTLTNCSKCINGYLYYQGECILNCPLKTISSLIPLSASLYECLSCSDSSCLKCSDINTCTLCVEGKYLYANVCLNSCPVVMAKQYYPDLNKICSPCQCSSCSNWSYNCTSCAMGLVFSSSKFMCLSKCQDGYYNSSGNCLKCSNQCLTCNSSTYCSICKEPYILYRNTSILSTCVNTCPTTTLLTIQTINSTTHVLQCIPCTLGCNICMISPSFCTQCMTGYLFYNNKCLSSCPVGTFNISNSCLQCNVQCLYCDSIDYQNCTQCKQGYYLNNNRCYVNCPQGTYPQISVKKCLTCQSLCQTCLNATHCTSCKSGFFLYTNNLCYNQCPKIPTLYYYYQSQCVPCKPQCNACLNSPVQCVTCVSNYYYQNEDTRQCSTVCATNYFVKGNMCVKCLSPCLTCDSTYYSCKSCDQDAIERYLYSGSCLNQCPNGYYPDNSIVSGTTLPNVCIDCPFPCATCSKTQCKTCQSFAFMYKTTCVLDCSKTADMPYQKDKYCTNCLSIPFCTLCQKSQLSTFVCWSCTYPYVLFQSQCLNNCPINYIINNQIQRLCIQSQTYLTLRQQTYQKNKPSIPFIFLIIFLLIACLIYPLSKFIYEYTYHIGYWIFLINFISYILIYNWMINYYPKYPGEYFDGEEKSIPLLLIGVGLMVNICVLGWIYFGYVIKYVYLEDVRYQEWKNKHFVNFVILVSIFAILGPKSHKLYYSKLFGLSIFSYRIVSVEKFHLQDRISLLSSFGDFLFIMAFFIVAYNVYIQFSFIYLTSIEFFGLKIIQWLLLSLDSKKPDRGFFYGDQKQVLEEILKEQEQQKARQLNRVDTDHLIKMIRQKSAALLQYDKHPFGQLDKLQFLSVYDPNDYQDVPSVPLKRIQRNIYKGKFRKGRKITIQQKLHRFADSIKPKPKVVKAQEYLNGLIYWKPPKKVKVAKQRIQPLSQESMLKILEDKEDQYRQQLLQIETIVFDQKPTQIHNFKTGQYFFKNTNHLNIQSYDDLENSNPSIQQFQDISSQIYKGAGQEIEYNDLLNLNYARKKHLPKQQKKPQFDHNQMRILYHQPMKKRPSRLQVDQDQDQY